MNGAQTAVSDLFWGSVAAVLGCAWTLGIHLGKAFRLLDDHETIVPPRDSFANSTDNVEFPGRESSAYRQVEPVGDERCV